MQLAPADHNKVNGTLMSVQMDLGFRQVDAEGRPIRRTAAQVAAILQLPEKRCANFTVCCKYNRNDSLHKHVGNQLSFVPLPVVAIVGLLSVCNQLQHY